MSTFLTRYVNQFGSNMCLHLRSHDHKETQVLECNREVLIAQSDYYKSKLFGYAMYSLEHRTTLPPEVSVAAAAEVVRFMHTEDPYDLTLPDTKAAACLFRMPQAFHQAPEPHQADDEPHQVKHEQKADKPRKPMITRFRSAVMTRSRKRKLCKAYH